MEKHLCSYDRNGEIVRDAGGKPLLSESKFLHFS